MPSPPAPVLHSFPVGAAEDGLRLDVFLAAALGVSRARARRALLYGLDALQRGRLDLRYED